MVRDSSSRTDVSDDYPSDDYDHGSSDYDDGRQDDHDSGGKTIDDRSRLLIAAAVDDCARVLRAVDFGRTDADIGVKLDYVRERLDDARRHFDHRDDDAVS